MRKSTFLFLGLFLLGLGFFVSPSTNFLHSTLHVLPLDILSLESALAQDEDFGAETIDGETLPGLIKPLKTIKSSKKKSNEDEDKDKEEMYGSSSSALSEEEKNAPLPSELNLNAKDLEISTLVKTISKITGRNYIVDSGVKGKITIHLPTAVTLAEALRIFDSVLLLKGFTTVPVDDNIWKIIKTKNAQTTTIPIVYDSPETPSDVLVTQLIRLKHVPAEDMRGVIQQFVSRDGGINTFDGTNSLILIDSAANIHRLLELVERLDVPATDQDITIIPIEHAEANDIAEKINDILGEAESSSPSSSNTNRRSSRTRSNSRSRTSRNRSSSRQSSSRASSERRRLPLKILPDERTNSLIVVADPELTVKVQALVEQLDSALDKSSGRFYVYKLQHAHAEELGEILNNLISGATSTTTAAPRSTRGSSLSRSSRNRTATTTPNNTRNTNNNNRRGTGNPNGGRVNFEGDVSIAPDPSTNSLIINASRSDYLRLKEVISELDIKRRQVLVEATLLEVSLTEDNGFGAKLQGSAGNDNGGLISQSNFGSNLGGILTSPAAFLNDPTALSDLTIAAASSGSLTLPGGITVPSQAAMITAFSNNSNVNVLSSPTILSTDNEEAEIIVGENVPFITSSGSDVTNLNNTFNSIERQDVGITLRITPQISQGDYVNLSIFVEISNVVPDTRDDETGPTTTIRTTETTVEVKDGQMIVTGGLISDNVTKSDNGVPVLKEIPILGHLFKTSGTNKSKNNLLVFITPRIIRDQFDARESTIQSRNKLEDFYIEHKGAPEHVAKLHNESINNVTEILPDSDAGVNLGKVTPPHLSNREKSAFEKTKSRLETLAAAGSGDNKKRLSKKDAELGVSAKIETIQTVSGDIASLRNESDDVLSRGSLDSKFLEGSNSLNSSSPVPLSNFPKINKGDEFGEGNIRIKAAPPLPLPQSISSEKTSKSNVKAKTSKSTVKAASSKPSASKNLAKTNKASANNNQSFIVLKSLNPETSKNNPSIKLSDSSGTLGIALPGAARNFFNPGVQYNNGSGKDNFVVLGRYSSVSEAANTHKSLSDPSKWDVLSNTEVDGLGKSSWLKAN